MLLDGEKIEITDVEGFFEIMDGYKKKILSKDISDGIPESEEYCVFVVADHAIGIPKDAPEALEEYFQYL